VVLSYHFTHTDALFLCEFCFLTAGLQKKKLIVDLRMFCRLENRTLQAEKP